MSSEELGSWRGKAVGGERRPLGCCPSQRHRRLGLKDAKLHPCGEAETSETDTRRNKNKARFSGDRAAAVDRGCSLWRSLHSSPWSFTSPATELGHPHLFLARRSSPRPVALQQINPPQPSQRRREYQSRPHSGAASGAGLGAELAAWSGARLLAGLRRRLVTFPAPKQIKTLELKHGAEERKDFHQIQPAHYS